MPYSGNFKDNKWDYLRSLNADGYSVSSEIGHSDINLNNRVKIFHQYIKWPSIIHK